MVKRLIRYLIIVSLTVLVGGAIYGFMNPVMVVTLSWDSNTESDLDGYKVHIGTKSRDYSLVVDIGDTTSYEYTVANSTYPYFFAITAYDTSGNESGYSMEVTTGIIDSVDNGGCDTTLIVPYMKVNNGSWEQASIAHMKKGGGVSFGPQPIDNNWEWEGPDNYERTSREITLDNIQKSSNYTAIYTNDCGVVTTQLFSIIIDKEPIIIKVTKAPKIGVITIKKQRKWWIHRQW